MSDRVVGIDLGTTHTVLAWGDADSEPRAMPIPQLVAPSQVASRELLPSCLYAPIEGEAHDDPFQSAPWIGGELARKRSAEVPGRAITSAKSWLCHAAVDRTAPILPWGNNDESMPKLSPVDASARILSHVARAWESSFSSALANEVIVLTVPASFDEVARELTLRAARDVGLAVSLLEEPQAAFYDYLRSEGELDALVRERGGHADVLVCDVGGGTTDLSIIRVTTDGYERVAVGRHILLGGDNMDLALAHSLEQRMKLGAAGSREAKLDALTFSQLVLACRRARETLSSADAPASVVVSLASRGSALVGGTLRAELTREEVSKLTFDGFFTDSELDRPSPARAALTTSGLPFERDPAITRHVRQFVRKHEQSGGRVDALLPNGGVFRAHGVVERVKATLGGAIVLASVDPDLAVARGAVRHGLARLGKGRRVRSGSSRAFYIGLAGEPPQAVCVLPKGAQEGTPHRAKDTSFDLVMNAPVRFDLYSRDSDDDRAGAIVKRDDSLEKLAPLAAQFGAGGRRAPLSARVSIEAELAVTGSLSIACVDESRRYALSFDLRSDAPRASIAPPSVPPNKLDAARSVIESVFGKASSGAPKELARDLEHALGERSSWDAPTARALFDTLSRTLGSRRRTVDHERVFFALAGTCLRPGYGAPGDEARSALMGKLFSERLGFPEETRGWQQFFVAYRRIAGGLDERTQTAIRDLCDGIVAPKEQKVARNKKFQPRAESELIELCAALERVPPARRVELGEWLLLRTWLGPSPAIWASIGRVGARLPAYASAHHVVSPETAERWLDRLLAANWSSLSTAPLAASRMARLTGDRSRDVSERVRRQVRDKLVQAGARDDLVRPLTEIVIVTEADRAEFYGESLPMGLALAVSSPS